MPSITDISSTPKEARDEWRTPRWLFDWLDRRFQFDIDLAAAHNNALCATFWSKEADALEQPWHKFKGAGFCNPPYSDIDPWLRKAVKEATCGFTSVFLISSPNGENHYGDYVFGVASEVIWITGRLSFVNSEGRAVGGNTRGSAIAIYEGWSLGDTRYRHIRRADIRREFDPEFALRRLIE